MNKFLFFTLVGVSLVLIFIKKNKPLDDNSDSEEDLAKRLVEGA